MNITIIGIWYLILLGLVECCGCDAVGSLDLNHFGQTNVTLEGISYAELCVVCVVS